MQKPQLVAGVGGRKAWDRAQLLAVEWGAANVQFSYI